MKKLFVAAILASALAAPALAASADMAALTCKDLLAADDETKGVILFWIDGYVSHKTGNTTFDVEGIKADGAKIGAYCASNPDAKVLEYVESATNQ